MKILMLSGDFNAETLKAGPITYARMTVPARALARQGHEVLLTPHFSLNYRTGEIAGSSIEEPHKRITGFDVVIAKQMMRLHHPHIIEACRNSGQQFWMDVDDWYFGIDTRNAAYEAIQKRSNPKTNVENLRKAFAASTGLICSTPYLRDRMLRINRNSVVARNAVEPDDWPEPKPLQKDMRVGWVAGLRHRSGDLETLKGVIEPFLKKHDATFVHVGYMPGKDEYGVEDLVNLDGCQYEVYNAIRRQLYSELAFEPFNVGIVPLSYQPFNEAKSNLKGLEYAMAGRPFIAAQTHEYQYLAACGVGRTAKRPQHWIRQLETLLDPDLREFEAEQNRAMAIQEFHIDRRIHEWVNALDPESVYSQTSDVSSDGPS